MSVGPAYHGIASDGLDDVVAAQGRQRDERESPRDRAARANSPYSRSISSNRSSEKSTRSILFTATATWRMPSMWTR